MPGWDAPLPITGISLAFAWALPDTPTYPENNLYDEGHLPLIQKRKDANTTENIASKESITKIAPTMTTSRIDLQTMMKLMRLFLPTKNSAAAVDPMALNANDIKAILDNIYSIDHSIRRQGSGKYWNASIATISPVNRFHPNDRHQFSDGNVTVANEPYPPLISLQSDVITNYRQRHADNAFRKYLAETYFRPWVESTSSIKCAHTFTFAFCISISLIWLNYF